MSNSKPEPESKEEKEARLFQERLIQTGQLVDVEVNQDLTKLPAHITHVRYPDGTVKRIRFAGSPPIA